MYHWFESSIFRVMCDIDNWEDEGGLVLTTASEDATLEDNVPSAVRPVGIRGLDRGPESTAEDARGGINKVGKSCIYTEIDLYFCP